MDVDLIFKIAAVGILVAVLNILMNRLTKGKFSICCSARAVKNRL